MHTTLDLRARRTELEANRARLHALLERVDVAHADVLQRMLHAHIQVRQERRHRSLVLHITRHALCHLDR